MTKFAHDTIVPKTESNLSKKQQVAEMFNDIAFRYDFLNRFLSAGIDVSWRKKAIRQLKELNPQSILDVATGTADVALLTHKLLKPKNIIGIENDPFRDKWRDDFIQNWLHNLPINRPPTIAFYEINFSDRDILEVDFLKIIL